MGSALCSRLFGKWLNLYQAGLKIINTYIAAGLLKNKEYNVFKDLEYHAKFKDSNREANNVDFRVIGSSLTSR